MSEIRLNGRRYTGGGSTNERELTLAEYEALGDVVNSDGVTYYIIDEDEVADASDVAYDNTNSGLSASNVQSAIDEVSNAIINAQVITGGDLNSYTGTCRLAYSNASATAILNVPMALASTVNVECYGSFVNQYVTVNNHNLTFLRTSYLDGNGNRVWSEWHSNNYLDKYTLTPDTTLVESSSNVIVKVKGNVMYIEAYIRLLNTTTIEAWDTVQIGTISGWDMTGRQLCTIMSTGENASTMRLTVDADGKVYIIMQGVKSTFKAVWHYGTAVYAFG